MTHFCTFVFTPDRPGEDDLEKLLWPWSLYNLESRYRRQFDYFQIGGRWAHALDPQASGLDLVSSEDRCQKQKRAIAVDALRERTVARAAKQYDHVHAILAGRSLPDIAELKRRHGESDWSTHFHADPSVTAVRMTYGFISPWELAALAAPRETVLSRASGQALLPQAFVSDGQWQEFDGMCLDEDRTRADVWRDMFKRVFDAAAPDSWLTVVDCHF